MTKSLGQRISRGIIASKHAGRPPVVKAALQPLVGSFVERVSMEGGYPVLHVETASGERVRCVLTGPENEGEKMSAHYEYRSEDR